ncbi:CBS domain-containing protein [Streptomyces sp. GLT-R25]
MRKVVKRGVVTIRPETSPVTVARLVRDHTIRRLPVTEDGLPGEMVSLCDLVVAQDPHSTLAGLSRAEPAGSPGIAPS